MTSNGRTRDSLSTVDTILTTGAQRHPHRVALRDSRGRALTYGELEQRVHRLVNVFFSLGVFRGDRIAAWLEDRTEYVELYLAAARLGAVVCPINARYLSEEAAQIIADAEPRALVWSAEVEDCVAQLPEELVESISSVCIGGGTRPGVMEYEAALAAASIRVELPAPLPEDLFILGYTSGTTGPPKGAMMTHRSVMEIARINAVSYRMAAYCEVELTGSMSFVSVVPAQVLCALRLGGTVNILGDWDSGSLVDAIQRHRSTFTYVPSPLIHEFGDAVRAAPGCLESLDSVLHSASKAQPEALAQLYDVVGDRLVEGWGMTEHSGGLATATSRSDYRDVAAGHSIFDSVGRPALDVEVRVLNASGEPLPHDGDAVGELAIASPALAIGYWRQQEATARAFTNDGWYHTGDLGAIDPDGYVRIADRRTDLIVSGGANVYPTEVEGCILRLDAVREVAVIGVPHPRWGEAVVAVVVPVRGAQLEEREVIDHCRAHLASYKKPLRVMMADSLPRTTSLKVARVALRETVGNLF